MTDQVRKAIALFEGSVVTDGPGVKVTNPRALRSSAMDQLVRLAVFGTDAEREAARWLLWELGQATGVRPASIHDALCGPGEGDLSGWVYGPGHEHPDARL